MNDDSELAMTLYKKGFLIKVFFVIYLSLLLTSCDSFKGNSKPKNLLLIAAESSELINRDEYNVRLNAIPSAINQGNLYYILSDIFFREKARNSVISISKNSHQDYYDVVIIYDDVSDDDSVSGYRYDIKIHQTDNDVWEFIEIRQSWRCWEGRGHREFSSLPCV